MEIKEISSIYSALPQCGAFLNTIADESVRHVYLKGLLASSASVFLLPQEGRVKREKRKVKREKLEVKNQARRVRLLLSLYFRTTMRQDTSITT